MDSGQPENLKLLIIDDDRELLETLSVVLCSDGYQVTCAESANEGLSLVQREKYDLVLVDFRMRRMDGHQFLRVAKLMDPSCKVAVMSAYATEQARDEAKRDGAFGYLTKPFKLAELQDTLRRATGESLPPEAHRNGIGDE